MWSTPPPLGSAVLGDSVHASLKGYWGFEPYEGPTFRLINVHAKSWELAAGDEAALIVGRQDTIHLQADSVSCVDGIMLKDPGGKELKVDWKTTRPDEVEIKLPLQDATPGAMTLLVTQYGNNQADPDLNSYLRRRRANRWFLHSCRRYRRHTQGQSPRRSRQSDLQEQRVRTG